MLKTPVPALSWSWHIQRSNVRPTFHTFRRENVERSYEQCTFDKPSPRSMKTHKTSHQWMTTMFILLLARAVHAQPGTLDVLFDPGAGANDSVLCVAAQPDGKVLVGGEFTQFAGEQHGHLVRLNADGSTDAFFNSGSGFDGNVLEIDLQPDGKAIVCGTFTMYAGTPLNAKIVRLDVDGSLDAGFSPPAFLLASVNAMAVQPDGKILVAGNMSAGPPFQIRLVRLLPTGALDPSFTTTTTSFNQLLTDVEVLPDGRIAVLGNFSTYQGASRNKICLLNPDGSLDNTFLPGSGFPEVPRDLAVAPDGKLLVAGFLTTYNGTPVPKVLRLNQDGSIDPSWTFGSGTTNGVPTDVLVQPDGNLIIAGSFTMVDGTVRNRICRLLPDGLVDMVFDPGSGPDQTVTCLSMSVDADYFIGGYFLQVAGSTRVRVARLSGCAPTPWYPDADGDGYGTGAPVLSCSQPPSTSANDLDCDDGDPLIIPGRYFLDMDEDGFGDASTLFLACIQPPGSVMDSTDCDDTNDLFYPGAEWFEDLDGDGYGNSATLVVQCIAPQGYIDSPGDCDDSDPLVSHGEVCDDANPFTVNDRITGNCVCDGDAINGNFKIILGGAFDNQTGLMRDDLRANGLLPLSEPYSALGYANMIGAGSSIDPALLSINGPGAIVDWVLLECRLPEDPSVIAFSRPCLLRRDGRLVDLDGSLTVRIPGTTSLYYLAVHHRNHLPVMTAAAGFPAGALLDLTDPGVPTFGSQAQQQVAPGIMAMWPGNANGDDRIKYTGTGNDRDPVLTAIGGTIPTAVVNGTYSNNDINMDGSVKYTGSNNDRDPILTTIGGTLPTAQRLGQVP